MLTVELIYDRDCPNVKEARAHLLRAFAETEFLPRWQEWERGAPESPVYVGTYGSPTILVNGHDVADASPSEGVSCCRLYVDNNGQFRGVPSVGTIASALLKATRAVPVDTGTIPLRGSKSGWRSILAMLPGIGTALMPKLTCPLCWPAYAGLLSSLGLGFINYTPYLLPLTMFFLILAVAPLTYRAKRCRDSRPFILGVLAAVIVIVGKFVFVSDVVMYGGIVLLIGAFLWNSWRQQRTDRGSCTSCISAESLFRFNKECRTIR